MTNTLKPIAILGAGSWGTALALNLARRNQTVNIWSIEHSEIAAMLADKANERYLPGFELPDAIHPMVDLAKAVTDITDVLVVVPSVGFKATLQKLKPLATKNTRIICASKGLDQASGLLLSDVAISIFGNDQPFAVLSGPSFAREVAAGLPTAVMIASRFPDFLKDLIHRFNSNIFRIYPTDDVIGVEVGGVVKNVIAIAIGIADGLNFGSNARNALLTFSLGEILRLGIALGGKSETIIGLAGLGDLMLTCTDNQSRNRRFGLAIGAGKDPQTAEKEIGQAVEGKKNAEAVIKLAHSHQITMPICEAVWDILQGKKPARDTLLALI